MSKDPISEQVPTCTGILLPYYPGFNYVAFKDDVDGSYSGGFTLFETKPAFLTDYIHALDVSQRKVIRS